MAAPGEVSGKGGVTRIAELVPSLPLETRCPAFPLRQYGGFWLPEWALPGLEAVHTRFKPRPSDIFFTSFPKSGTTWLKALAFATVNRAAYPPSDEAHPLRHCGPHDCVKFLESTLVLSDGGGGDDDVFAALPSPRLLSTHLPYSHLPGRITADSSGCRIVYICRDPMDTIVSWWLFIKKTMAAKARANKVSKDQLPLAPYTIEDELGLFCDGRCANGPYWRHVLEYLEESQKRPQKVLFLRYEEMLRDPTNYVKKLAEFMGCPFSGEEEADGVAEAIVHLCSFDHLKSLEVNKTGVNDVNVSNDSFFRKGVTGDWSNHLSPETAARLDSAVEDALRGSGFTFAASGNSA